MKIVTDQRTEDGVRQGRLIEARPEIRSLAVAPSPLGRVSLTIGVRVQDSITGWGLRQFVELTAEDARHVARLLTEAADGL